MDNPYYYAGGKRVTLEPEKGYVAVDQSVARLAGFSVGLSGADRGDTRSGAGILVAPLSSLPGDLVAGLRDAGALRPVYRRDKAVLVLLPEVRVEFDDENERRRVLEALEPSACTIVEDGQGRIVVRPASSGAEDALALANHIHETASPAAASPRFIQFIPKPNSGRATGSE